MFGGRARSGFAGEGDLVAGRYRLVEQLGKGGFGEVWTADDLAGGPRIALKLLTTAGTPQQITRFKDEFAILTRLQHPHINPVYDFGCDERLGYFFTSAIVRGLPMDEALKFQPYRCCEQLIAQALRALAYLHAQGIHHFDIKPRNLLVEHPRTPAAQVKLIDFGLSTLEAAVGQAGTASYMAPELILHQPADARADLYALGVTFYVCVAGTNPFKHKERNDTLVAHLQHVPQPPSLGSHDAPTYIDPFILRLLAKSPSDRYASAAHALRELQLLSPAAHAIEERETQGAYLPSGNLVIGMPELKMRLRRHCTGPMVPAAPLLLTGGPGRGKSTLLAFARFEALLADHPVFWLSGPDDPQLDYVLERCAQCVADAAHLDPDHPPVVLVDALDRCVAPEAPPELARLFDLLQPALRGEAPATPRWRIVATTRGVPPAGWERATVLDLPPFTPTEVGEYLTAIAPLDPATRDRLVAALMPPTGGVPGLVAAAVRHWLAQGYLVDAGGQWDAGRFADITLDLPSVTLEADELRATLATLQHLPPVERDLLGWIAAWETAATRAEILGAAGEGITAVPPEAWTRLCAGGWLAHDAHEGTYRCTDVRIRSAASAGLSPEERRRRADAIAQWLQAQNYPAEAIDPYLAAGSDPYTAHAAVLRLSQADQQQGRLPRAIARLRERLESLGSAEARSRSAGAAECIDQTRDLAPGMDLIRSAARACLQADRSAEGETIIREWQQRLHRKLGPIEGAECYEWRGLLALRARRLDEADRCFTKAEAFATKIDPPWRTAWQLRLRNDQARLAMERGDLTAATTTFAATWTAAASLPTPQRATLWNNEWGQCLLLQGDTATAIRQLQMERDALSGDLHRVRRALRDYLLGRARLLQSDLHGAMTSFEQALAAAQQEQDLRLVAVIHNAIGNLYSEQQSETQAQAAYARAIPLCYRVGDRVTAVHATLNAARLHVMHAELTPADTALRAVLTFVQSGSLPAPTVARLTCPVYQLLGDVARQRRNWKEADDFLRLAWDLSEAHCELDAHRLSILLTQAETARDAGRPAEARAYLAAAHSHLRTDRDRAIYDTIAASILGEAGELK